MINSVFDFCVFEYGRYGVLVNSWCGGGFVNVSNCSFVNIDEPTHYGFVNKEPVVTSNMSYVRLHGRNKKDWFRKDASRDERYNYLYSTDELTPWVERIRKMSKRAKKYIVITNNHFKGSAVCNILQLKSMFNGEKVKIPSEILANFPQVEEYSASDKGVFVMAPSLQ